MEEHHTLSVRLNLDKLKSLLNRHGYILEQVYCQRQSIRFVECRTPKYQKTFIIYIPERYTLTLPPSSSLKRLNITTSESPPTPYQIRFMSDMKGTLLECDLLSISSEMLCIYLNSGDAECFYITETGCSESEDETEDDEECKDEVDTLERDTVRLLQKVDPGAKLPKAVLRKKRKKSDEDHSTSSNDSSDLEEKSDEDSHKESSDDSEEKSSSTEEENKDRKVELFFEDENGDSVDEVKSLLENPSHVEDSLHRIKEKIENKDSEKNGESETENDSENEEYTVRDNSLPPEIEEGEVSLGIVYVLIDIRQFFKVVAKYEDDLISHYNQIEDNEEELRQQKLSKVKNLCHEIITHSEKRLKDISEEEERLKIHLVRLTIVLTQSDSLKIKVENNPSKYGVNIIAETARIYQETRMTIYDLNMEILKLRDTTEDLLSNYISSMQELLQL